MNLVAPPTVRSRVRLIDVFGLGGVGVVARPWRTLLTALGIAIGIAALVAVVGISTSSKADLLRQIDRFGTNLMEVRAGQTLFGKDATLPSTAPAMIRRIGPVDNAASVAAVLGATVRRNDRIPAAETGGISVTAAELNLLGTVGGTVREGRWLDGATASLPSVVLGSNAARRLGISSLTGSPLVWLGGQRFAVVGILDPVPLLANLDSSAFVGIPIARAALAYDEKVSSVYVRTPPASVDAVRKVLAATANPVAPNEVSVSRPSDALKARNAVDKGLTALLLGLGGVALLVGGIGIANVMVISVLERRAEIGLRRAVGATKRHVRLQFVTESAMLALLGGIAGVALGTAVTAGYARLRDLPFTVPPNALAAGVGAAVTVGIVAGLIPAARAARMPPAEALRL